MTTQRIDVTQMIISATSRLVGRVSAGAGVAEEVILDSDTSMAASSDSRVPTQNAVTGYIADVLSYYAAEISTGWIPINDSWTRTGNFTFSIGGSDLTSIYRKGAKIRYKDGGAYEYGVVASSSYSGSNIITLITNSDFAMAAATITDRYISYVESPEGFPHWFNYTPTYAASGSMTVSSPSTTFAMWMATASKITVEVRFSVTTGGSASNTLTATLPINPLTLTTTIGSCFINDASNVGGFSFIASNLFSFRKYDNSNFALAAGKVAGGVIIYDF